MDGVMKKLKDGVIKKIIVARKCTVETTAPFDPFGYAEYLIDRFYQEYFYLFRHGPAQQWIGITPENLFKGTAGDHHSSGRHDPKDRRRREGCGGAWGGDARLKSCD